MENGTPPGRKVNTVNGKVIIGNEEWCAFPVLGVPAIKARIDSGARTTALHALHITPFMRDGHEWVSFDINPLTDQPGLCLHCEAPVVGQRSVKNSFGNRETRYVISTTLAMGPFLWETEVSLTNRDSMEYRMLLGRNAMQDHVLVDPARGCYLGDYPPGQLKRLYADEAARPPIPSGKPYA